MRRTYGTDKKKCWLKKTDTGFEHQANRISGEKNKVTTPDNRARHRLLIR